MGRIMICATHSGAGKTTISSGIMRAIKNKGLLVQAYKVGPDYIDTSFHLLATGNPSRNIDEFILTPEEIINLVARSSKNKDISIIEGVMGMFDGNQSQGDYCSSASMSKILRTPVILIIDGKGMAGSAAALAQGFMNFDKNVSIQGFIINNVQTDNHYRILKEAIEAATHLPVLGRFPKNENIILSSRHLGLVPQHEAAESEKKITMMAEMAQQYLDLDKIIEIAKTSVPLIETKEVKPFPKTMKLGVAMDEAFHFYYEDSLELLNRIGMEIIPFSPIKDASLPKVDGLYIGGGYPELFAEELSANKTIRQEIFEKSKEGMPIYAECGGLMYLGETLMDFEGNSYDMVGVFSGKSIMSPKLQRFGYCTGVLQKDSIIGSKGHSVRGHEFHHSVFETQEESIYLMSKTKSDGTVDSWLGGYYKNRTLASYLHTHFCSDYTLAYNFYRNMEIYHDTTC